MVRAWQRNPVNYPDYLHRVRGAGDYGPQSGFTIIELMVTMAIITIVATVAVPGFMTMSQDNRLAVRHNDFLGTLNLARNEALTRGTRVTICKWGIGPDCNGQEWEDGWIVFVDTDADGIVDGGESVVRIYPPLNNNNTLRGINTAANQIVFNAQGMLPAPGILTFCDSRGDTQARGLILSRSGQARVAVDSNGNGIRDDNGNDLACPP